MQTADLVSVNGTHLFCETAGAGQDMVLVSGGGLLDRRMWNDQFATLVIDHRVIRYDVRGIGRSAGPDGPFSHSADLAALLRELRTGPVDLVGLSLGAAIAIDFVLEHPALVRRLVLASPGLSSDREANLNAVLPLGALARERGMTEVIELLVGSPALLATASPRAQHLLRTIYADNGDVFHDEFRLIRWWRPASPPADGRLSTIRTPTLVLVGERDGEDTRRVASMLMRSIPGASTVVVAGAAHLIQMDAPDEFTRSVCAFLTSP